MQPAPSPLAVLAPGVSREFLLRHGVCPTHWTAGGRLAVACAADDHSVAALAELADWYKCETEPRLVARTEFEQICERVMHAAGRELELEQLDATDDRTADVRELANQPPVIRFVNLLLREASDIRASDVHLEATRSGSSARFRVDGVLVEAPEPPRHLYHAVVSRLKTIAELDIAERRRPQDGRIHARLEDRDLDVRVSTVPTMHGESVVLRLLDRGGRAVTLDELGMPRSTLDGVRELVERPHGLMIVTGPTGSGKTTTLYAALQHRDAAAEKIVTVEDPVEYELSGVTQVPVVRQAGVTFASALRAILRQDPDVVMVGEMRDRETAEIAIQAAMTGHLVLSTLHTNDALGVIPRLLDLGVEDYLIGGTLEGVIAQRLVRRNCAVCAVEDLPDANRLASLAGRPVGRVRALRGAGCPECRGTGFRGRMGLFELVRVTDRLRAAISHRGTHDELRDAASVEGFTSMRQHGAQLVMEGLTTVDEVWRVLNA